MIEITEIDKNISIYKNNKVILWGDGGFLTKRYIEIFEIFKIDIYAFCNRNSNIHEKSMNGIDVISLCELKTLVKKDDNIIIQIVTDVNNNILIPELIEIGVKKYISEPTLVHNLLYLKKYSGIEIDEKFSGNSDNNNIRLTKLDEELTIYKNKKVIIWGTSEVNKKLLSLFTYHKIEIVAFCSPDENVTINNINGIPIISHKYLPKYIGNDNSFIIQIGFSTKYYKEIIEKLKEDSIEICISFHEAIKVLEYLKRYEYISSIPTLYNKTSYLDYTDYTKLHQLREHLISDCNSTAIIVCSTQKTGDNTLNSTFDKYNIPYINTMHSINAIDKSMFNTKIFKNIKIITGIRDPISLVISRIYQYLSTFGNNQYGFSNFSKILFPFEKESFLKNGGDIQYVFDKYSEYILYSKSYVSSNSFIDNFCNKIVDIKKEPFDKEKGYKIIKEGNIEVFVYQLEQLNNIVPELSKFVGVPFDKLENANVADDKWISASYKQALKELKISQEFFDKCFSEPYVEHFYSQEDINKFKERWHSHIRV